MRKGKIDLFALVRATPVFLASLTIPWFATFITGNAHWHLKQKPIYFWRLYAYQILKSSQLTNSHKLFNHSMRNRWTFLNMLFSICFWRLVDIDQCGMQWKKGYRQYHLPEWFHSLEWYGSRSNVFTGFAMISETDLGWRAEGAAINL